MKASLQWLREVQWKATAVTMLLLAASVSINAEVPPIISVIKSDTVQTHFGYQIEPLGDQNSDGYADFAVWDYRFAAYLYHGGNPPDSVPYLRIDSINFPITNIGDINVDGYNDFTIPGRSPVGWKLGLYHGGPSADSVRDLWFGWDTLFPHGRAVAGYDIDCSGGIETFCREANQWSVLQCELSATLDSIPSRIIRPWWFPQLDYVFGNGLVLTDLNGNGISDLIISLMPSLDYSQKGEVCCYWGGCDFDTVPELRLTQPGAFAFGKESFGSVLAAIDINCDGYSDIFVGHGNSVDTTNYVYFGGPEFDSIPDLIIPDYTERAAPAGDINGDGYEDMMTSFSMLSSSFSYVNIYYGGPDVDNVIDLQINVWEVPGYQVEFGMGIAGVGDVNGDSINDFAVSAIDADGRGEVFIFSGTSPSTDVEIVVDEPIPDAFDLRQNYPNPFNPSTTIEFELVNPARAIVRVYNAIGEVVRTLVDRQLAVGTHRVVWDGRDDQGREVASGVYLYRLTAGDVTQEKKMVLVR